MGGPLYGFGRLQVANCGCDDDGKPSGYAHIDYGEFLHGDCGQVGSSSALYVIAMEGVEACKVGISHDPQNRLYWLQRKSKRPLRLVQVFMCDNAPVAERAVHELLGHCAIGREWFACSPNDAVQTVQKVLTV